jgi:branched-chain amino acid transport system ATP-binding protein
MTAGLRVVGATAGYGGTEVLRDVTLTVPPGRVVALLGANGAGKTTLLRMCSGLLPPSHGRVTLDGVDVTNASTSRLGRLGLCHVPEGRAVFPTLTVEENVRLMAPPGRADALDRACEAFPPLGHRLRQVAGTLSGGEQQMLALCRAYLTDPRYVLLDEVSMGLAPRVVDAIFEALRRLAAGGTALLIVEQYVAKALELADIAYLLRRGQVAFCGEPVELDADALARSYLGDGPDLAVAPT